MCGRCKKKQEEFKRQLLLKNTTQIVNSTPLNIQRLLDADYNTLTEKEKRIRIRYKRKNHIK